MVITMLLSAALLTKTILQTLNQSNNLYAKSRFLLLTAVDETLRDTKATPAGRPSVKPVLFSKSALSMCSS